MNLTMRLSVFALSALPAIGASGVSSAQQANMSFFVTNAGSGRVPTSAAWRARIGSANS